MRENDQLLFSLPEYERRLRAVRDLLEQRDLSGLIITSPENIFYLCGYRSFGYYYFQALVVPREGEPFLVLRTMEMENANRLSWVDVLRPYTDTEDPITALRYSLGEFGIRKHRIGYEKRSYFFRATEQEQLFTSVPEAAFVDCSGCIDEMRVVKSEEELVYMREAARISTTAMRAGIDAVAESVAENEVAAAILGTLAREGSEYPAAPPVVASGWRGALGHPSFERRRIGAQECVLLELGANVHCYHAAIMRTVCVGEPVPEMTEAQHLLSDALAISLQTIRPGVAAGDVDVQNRYVLDRFAHGGTRTNRVGLSMGVAFAPHWGEGEAFSVQAGNPAHFTENMVLYLVPWLHVPGRFGIGMAETVLVTAEGCEPLQDLERELILR